MVGMSDVDLGLSINGAGYERFLPFRQQTD